MRLLHTAVWLSAAWLSSLVLSACGGGGGGGDNNAAELKIGQISPTSLEATIPERSYPSFAQFTLTAPYSGSPPGSVYVVVEDPDGVFGSATYSLGTAQASLTLMVDKVLPAGRYNQALTLRICKDAACKSEFAGSPQRVAKNIVVETLTVGATRLDFRGEVGLGAPAQALTVTPAPGKTFDYAPTLVLYTGPSGQTSLIEFNRVFDISRTTTGLMIQPKAQGVGRFTWTLVVNSGDYPQRSVDITYDVAQGNSQALTLLTTALDVSDNGGGEVFADIDVLVNFPHDLLAINITGSPDPVSSGWIRFYQTVPFTPSNAPTANGQHVRFKLDRCGYSAAFGCLGGGTATATVKLDVQAHGQTWTYTVPVTFRMR